MPEIEWFLPHETDFTMRDFVISILQRCFSSTFELLIKTNGAAEVLAALKPHMMVIYHSYFEGTKKAMNIPGNDAAAMLMAFMAGQAFIIPTDKLKGEITELGAVGTAYTCPFKNLSPEICIYLSHFGTEAVCRLIDNDYECVFTHHMTNGDPYCRYIFKRKSQKLRDPEDLGEVITTLPDLEIPEDHLYAMKLGGLTMQWNGVTSAFVQMNGAEKAREVLYPNARRIGEEAAEKMKQTIPCLSENAETLGLLVSSLAQVLNQRYTPKSVTPNEFVMEVTDCSCQTFSPEICGQIGALFDGMVQTLNPEYEFGYDRMITKGDKACHWTVRKKVRPIQADDPLKVLRMRLARGEITKEEYGELKALLDS